MTRLYVISEGLTEVTFVTQILKPHLETRATGRLVVTAPKLNGQYTYAGLRKLIQQLLGSPGSPVVVTTMIDLFKIAKDFPGRNGPQDPNCVHRVEQLERLCAEEVGSERFQPYIQLHEFEALVIAGLPKLSEQYPGRSGAIQSLADRLSRDYPTPEHVNDLQPPSYRIKQIVPEYSKTVGGFQTVRSMGLDQLRLRCPHFAQWVTALERLGAE